MTEDSGVGEAGDAVKNIFIMVDFSLTR